MYLLETKYQLSLDDAQKITSESERVFALRCLAVGCVLYYQVPVGHSVIDFLVENPKVPQSSGTLVEVTLMDKEWLHKKRLKKLGKHTKTKRKNNVTGKRKERQIQSMKDSGWRWTILYKNNIAAIVSGLK